MLSLVQSNQRIALRTGAGGSTTGLQWLISDHLGTTSKAPRAATGSLVAQISRAGQLD